MRTLSPTPVRLLSAALSRCDLDAPPAPATRSAATGTRETSLHHVLSGEALRAVFQPLVELTSGDVVGYEALVRGPADSELERPDALFGRARADGRLGELDWACRAAAVRGALDAGLPRGLRLFVNMEPEALGVPCPDHLLELWSHARDLDVVVEVTERALTSRPADLLHALEAFRALGWSIALDDVGADSRSLALLALLRPDVVKLDLRLVQARPDERVAEIVTAINAYAERTGAVVLAEGIENEEHLAAAHAVGATHGQGWFFGRPGPFAGVAGLRCPHASVRGTSGPRGRHHAVRGRRPGAAGTPWRHLLSAFQTAERFTPTTRARYSHLADRVAFVAALGTGLEGEPAPGVRGATLADDDALKDEWSVVVLAPHFAGALVAVDLGDRGPDDERRFDFALTYDRDLVMDAASSLMRRVQPLA